MLEDLNLTTRTLKIHGKGSKDRFVYLGARSCKALRKWIETVVKRLGAKADIDGLHPHRLRATSATMAMRNGMYGFSLQRLYGWEQIATAMHYVALAGTALREAHAKASPVDRLLENISF